MDRDPCALKIIRSGPFIETQIDVPKFTGATFLSSKFRISLDFRLLIALYKAISSSPRLTSPSVTSTKP